MNIQAIHSVLIALHSAAGVISLVAGCVLIFSPKHITKRAVFALYWWPLVGLVVSLAGALLVYWTEYSNIERIIFPALFMLGIYMLYRGWRANLLLASHHNAWIHDTIEHIGFTLISLFDGFVIIAVLNAGGPGWLVTLVAILGVLVGRWAIGLAQRRAAQARVAP